MAIGIILAGGYSSRTKTNKMALMIEEKPLLHHTIAAMAKVVDDIIIVSGHHHEEIKQLTKAFKHVEVVYNQAYDQGMFASVKCGFKHAHDSVLIQPGDMPFVKASTYQTILNGHGLMRIPVYQGKKGHPIYIDITLKEELLNTKAPHLKAFRDQHDFHAIAVDDSGILIDIDTMADYKKFRKGL